MKEKENRWLLRLIVGVPGEHPWVTKPLEYLNLVVEADTEGEARNVANKYDEDKHREDLELLTGVKSPWLTEEYCACIRIG